MEFLGMKGYKKSGFFEGLVGTVEKSDIKGFEHLYTIRFDNGSGVLASKNDICIINEMKIDIEE